MQLSFLSMQNLLLFMLLGSLMLTVIVSASIYTWACSSKVMGSQERNRGLEVLLVCGGNAFPGAIREGRD